MSPRIPPERLPSDSDIDSGDDAAGAARTPPATRQRAESSSTPPGVPEGSPSDGRPSRLEERGKDTARVGASRLLGLGGTSNASTPVPAAPAELSSRHVPWLGEQEALQPVRDKNEARMRLDRLPERLRSIEDCQALKKALQEPSDGVGVSMWSCVSYGQALDHLLEMLAPDPDSGSVRFFHDGELRNRPAPGERAFPGTMATARKGMVDAMRRGATGPEAAEQAIAGFERKNGYPLARDEDLQELRLHGRDLEAAGGPRMDPLHLALALDDVADAMHRGATGEEAAEQVITGNARRYGYAITRDDDLQFIRRHGRKLEAEGGPRTDASLMSSVRDKIADAMRHGATGEAAADQAIAGFGQDHGYPLAHPKDLQELRLHAQELAAAGGPRAAHRHLQEAIGMLHQSVTVLRAMGKDIDPEATEREFLDQFEAKYDYRLHQDDVQELREFAGYWIKGELHPSQRPFLPPPPPLP